MYLRTHEEHLQGPAAVVKGVGTALAVYSAVRDFFSSGGFTVNSDIARYTRSERPPGSKLLKCTRWFRIATYPDFPMLPKQRLRGDSFLFKLEYEYDGSNLIGVRILPQEKGSSNLYKSKFDITFAGKELSLPEDPVAVIRYYISGKWEPWDPISSNRYNIEGELDVRADGSASLAVRSPGSNRVLADPMTNSCTVVAPYVPKAPVRKHYSLRPPILFPFGKAEVSKNDERRIYEWINSWPSGTLEKIVRGVITVNVEGFASRPGGEYSAANARLADSRKKNVENILKKPFGDHAKILSRSYGAWRRNLPHLFDLSQWLQRFFDPNKYDQAVVIRFEDVE
jgi:hypothetical protein